MSNLGNSGFTGSDDSSTFGQSSVGYQNATGGAHGTGTGSGGRDSPTLGSGQNQRRSIGFNNLTSSGGTGDIDPTRGSKYGSVKSRSAHSASGNYGDNTGISGGTYGQESSQKLSSRRQTTGYTGAGAGASGPGSAYASSTTAPAHATGPVGSGAIPGASTGTAGTRETTERQPGAGSGTGSSRGIIGAVKDAAWDAAYDIKHRKGVPEKPRPGTGNQGSAGFF
ncbi:hypothetical protein BDQ12DRAFT_373517 [Crucibulum laeve]|uniref:Uncharacterized protein n=1 Tax=Crucibulum laeve TaxID=68775 RepID=A0A5C3LPN0_9AGAR|nr:hypothetical protein BDQ12DRAFT_373517 [Crucibulum laeve]